MEITVCPSCGAVLKSKDKSCGSCGDVSSRFAATVMATPVTSSAPMVVSVAPDRLILERIVSARQLAVHAPSDYGREEDYSAAGLFDPFASNDTFQEFDPVFVDTSNIGNGQSGNTYAGGNGEDSQGNGNGHNGSGNGSGNGQNGNGGGSVADPDPSQSAAGLNIAAFNVTAAPVADQHTTPFASDAQAYQNSEAAYAPSESGASAVEGQYQPAAAQEQSAQEQPAQEQPAQYQSEQRYQGEQYQQEVVAQAPQYEPAEQQTNSQAAYVQESALQDFQAPALAAAEVEQAQAQAPAQSYAEPAPAQAPSPVSALSAPTSPIASMSEPQPAQAEQTVAEREAPPGQVERVDGPPPPMANSSFESHSVVQANTVVVAEMARAAVPTESAPANPQQFDPGESTPPQRPKVAAPDFFASAPSTKPKQASSDNGGDEMPRPRPAAQSGPAFDFFAASSPSSAKAASSREDNDAHAGEGKTPRSEKNDALSSFENLLAKQSKTGQNSDLSEKGRAKSREKERDLDHDDYADERPKVAIKSASSSRLALEQKEERAKAARSRRGEEEEDEYAGYGDDEPKKTKRPPLTKVRSRRDERDDDDDDDDLDDDDHDFDEDEKPKRRNFSGGASASRSGSRKTGKPPQLKSAGKINRRRIEEDDEHEEDGVEGTYARLREQFQSGGLNIAGFPINVGHLCLGAFIIGLLFFAITHVMGNLANLGGGGGGAGTATASAGQTTQGAPMLGQAPTVSGIWAMDVKDKDKIFSGIITLNQSGNQITGKGGDKIGTFTLQGWMQDATTIVLKKRFVDTNGRESGPIITFTGHVAIDQVPMRAQGTWEFTKKTGSQFGYLNKATATTFSGPWRAVLRKSMPADGPPIFAGAMPAPSLGSPTTAQDTANKFNIIKFAIGNGIWIALGAGILLICSSFFLFGPDGMINVWNKQQYIPSQFKHQHGKIRGQLARSLRKGSLPLGQRVEWKWYFPAPWIVKDLALPPDMRRINPHVLILGQGGKGKTRLIANMVAHDIESNDRAVVAIDSDGTLVDLITRFIAAHPRGAELTKRVILIDPTYKGDTIAFNPLEMPERGDIQSAATSIVYGFKAIYSEPPGSQSQWNAQTADILRNSVLLLMANDKTLLDLPALLQDNDFRDIMLETVERRKNERVEFATLLDQWGRYKKLARTDQWITWVEPILNRLNPMLSNPRIRAILTEPNGHLKINDVIVGKKILLVKIPQGEFGQDANLLGSLIVSGVKQAALTLSSVAPKTQQEVALYLDNFDNFIEKETVDNITSETKKFKIGLIGVTKSLQHLPEDFKNQLIINVGTLITFALSKKDGDMLGPQMFPIDGRKVKHQTMANLFNRVNTSPQFELVSDEEKLNIDKIVRQEERTFFCYRMGAEAGLFNLKAHAFEEIPNGRVKKKLLQKMHLSSIKKSNSSDES
ncbi:MAG: hypothetical protein KGS72_15190 [Cyanobacteria bacterium REEB67]|nr:hypothetical protein [Cyanobacteria bacterium REEB67]